MMLFLEPIHVLESRIEIIHLYHHFKPIWRSYKFECPSLTSKDMRQPLKERIQNAINQAVLHEEVAYGALIVGGRRVTRKKRKHKPVKKDQNNNTKKNKKQQEKNKKYFKLVEEEVGRKMFLLKFLKTLRQRPEKCVS
ncbi:hypothetical protein LOTGIDRAFT_169897 [Lottia gigantea]|uniref:Uncharacterized protein n=1 Tax=Lottia gigantea TaxID=225164 RepID=V3ZNZ9_LOTGI|nr:hypothetical protein LOTGIDRAFT_169897 [Lottia gigantea]ESO82576.1 hypothetical protein LOTGIDRAFT_169897 [Lottia gigantea]